MQQTQQLNATIIYQSAPTSPDVLVVKHHLISALSFFGINAQLLYFISTLMEVRLDRNSQFNHNLTVQTFLVNIKSLLFPYSEMARFDHLGYFLQQSMNICQDCSWILKILKNTPTTSKNIFSIKMLLKSSKRQKCINVCHDKKIDKTTNIPVKIFTTSYQIILYYQNNATKEN